MVYLTSHSAYSKGPGAFWGMQGSRAAVVLITCHGYGNCSQRPIRFDFFPLGQAAFGQFQTHAFSSNAIFAKGPGSFWGSFGFLFLFLVHTCSERAGCLLGNLFFYVCFHHANNSQKGKGPSESPEPCAFYSPCVLYLLELLS